MYLEERVTTLEAENKELRKHIEVLEQYGNTRYVTVKELAELMKCSAQNIHRRIKTGEIQVTRRLGDPRIPMCQFLEDLKTPQIEKTQPRTGMTMAEQIFG